MAKLALKKATTSKILRILILDALKGDGSGLTGLVFNSAGLDAFYIREGAASPTAIALVTATVGTWTSGGFIEVDATDMPGVYELHVPDAVLATGANSVAILLKGATSMVPLPLEIQLNDNDPGDVWNQILEGALTAKQIMRLLVAASAGQLSGAATTTIVIKSADTPGKTRLTATVDSNGNRTSVTADVSDI